MVVRSRPVVTKAGVSRYLVGVKQKETIGQAIKTQQVTADPRESDKRPRYTTPPRRGWQSLHWSGVIKTSARVGEGKNFQFIK